MNYEEFKEYFTETLKDPDSAVATANEFLDKVKSVFDESESYLIKIKELENKNNDLRDSNIKLLLRETSQISDEETKEPTREEILSDVLSKIKGVK